jgi:hypothetical protein
MYPASVLNPDFVAAVRSHGVRTLAALAAFPHHNALHTLLRADLVAKSPRNVARLTAIAGAIGFDGPLFLADGEEVAS